MPFFNGLSQKDHSTFEKSCRSNGPTEKCYNIKLKNWCYFEL